MHLFGDDAAEALSLIGVVKQSMHSVIKHSNASVCDFILFDLLIARIACL